MEEEKKEVETEMLEEDLEKMEEGGRKGGGARRGRKGGGCFLASFRIQQCNSAAQIMIISNSLCPLCVVEMHIYYSALTCN